MECPPSSAPLIVQTLSVTAHMLFSSHACFSYGQAHSNSLQTWRVCENASCLRTTGSCTQARFLILIPVFKLTAIFGK